MAASSPVVASRVGRLTMANDRMSDRNQKIRPRLGVPLFDPEAFACWRLVERFPAQVRSVRLVQAKAAAPDDRLDGHLHVVPTVVCCLNGAARVETARGVLDLGAGEVAVVAPGAWHRHAPLRGQSAIYAQGLIGRRSDVLLATPERRWWLTVPEDPSRGLLARALSEAAADRLAAVAELVAEFAREPASALAMTPQQAAMARFLWNNVHRPVTAADVLRASGLGRAQAHATFVACFGEAPKQALTRSRLALAERLEAEGVHLHEVAARSGFVDRQRLRRVRRRTKG